jgi:2-keto-4-pentenoate hydratase/2-oxohepta-3-ene-1,7-dioic acid hydratase in catechol pathway
LLAQVLIVGTPMMFHAKAFDTFAPFGPIVATDIDPSDLDTAASTEKCA